jgi:hypothetical protein
MIRRLSLIAAFALTLSLGFTFACDSTAITYSGHGEKACCKKQEAGEKKACCKKHGTPEARACCKKHDAGEKKACCKKHGKREMCEKGHDGHDHGTDSGSSK